MERVVPKTSLPNTIPDEDPCRGVVPSELNAIAARVDGRGPSPRSPARADRSASSNSISSIVASQFPNAP